MIAILSDRRPYLLYVAVGALCLVGASYVRPTSLPLIAAVPFFGILLSTRLAAGAGRHCARRRRRCRSDRAVAARNQAHFDKPVLVSANFGANLWMGN